MCSIAATIDSQENVQPIHTPPSPIHTENIHQPNGHTQHTYTFFPRHTILENPLNVGQIVLLCTSFVKSIKRQAIHCRYFIFKLIEISVI